MPVPPDYAERVYAGVLGKIIGVYLGRPFEGWTHDRIARELGEVDYYVHDRLGKPLVVTDDDISGTFTFLRALEDYGADRDIKPEQIGATWLNYIIEKKTILWWGGMGHSTEHTAYLRLKHGYSAPRSGSIDLNGQVVAEQIGAQIFIDGWGMVAPGNPFLAADLARRAASVSHDGEAIHAAQVVAAMEAQAFVEHDIDALLDAGLAVIPEACLVARLIGDLRGWRQEEPDWRTARDLLDDQYGYHRYGGNCHVVPNHGLIILALLYGDGDFQRSLMIVNTCGWDTDCNSGNVGCLLGIRGGLAALDGPPDWRGPVADRMYLPTADGGRAITDALTQAYRIANLGGDLAGEPLDQPKNGARFHFSLPGSVQGFRADGPSARGAALRNTPGPDGSRSLEIRLPAATARRSTRVTSATFVLPEALEMPGYGLIASPTLYPGQTVRLMARAPEENPAPVSVHPVLDHYCGKDSLIGKAGPERCLSPGEQGELEWRIPDTGGYPIAAIGVQVSADPGPDAAVSLTWLTWDGTPEVALGPTQTGTTWQRAWVPGVDVFESTAAEPFRLIQNEGTGLLIQGTRDWTDYMVAADFTPHLVASAGLCARVQGMRRFYCLELGREGWVRLIKWLDGARVLAQKRIGWEFDQCIHLRLTVSGSRIRGMVDQLEIFDVRDDDGPLTCGAVALLVSEGRVGVGPVTVEPAD